MPFRLRAGKCRDPESRVDPIGKAEGEKGGTGVFGKRIACSVEQARPPEAIAALQDNDRLRHLTKLCNIRARDG